jgi:tetratricopeptide (TPR) repeat protein
VALIACAGAVGAAPALAVAGWSSSGSSDEGAADLTTCSAGLIWDARNSECVQAHRGVLPDKELTQYAYALMEAGRYQEVLALLDLLDNPETARALNYRAFATRKLGGLDEAIGYYLKAVALDPRYTQVREYLGEAYVEKGRLDLAERQLTILETLCGTSCEEYLDLAEAIAAGRGR